MFKKLVNLWPKSPQLEEGLFPEDKDKFHQNPYSYYERLRKEAPFYQLQNGTWVLSKADDIKLALNHPSLGNTPSRFSSLHVKNAQKYTTASLANNIMPFLDGSKHKDQRRLIAGILQSEVLRAQETMELIAKESIESLGKSFMVLNDLATPFSLKVICHLLGIPNDPKLLYWSDHFFYLFTKIPSVEVRSQIDNSLNEFRVWVKKQNRKSGILAALDVAIKKNEIDEQVAIDCIILLFADGMENIDKGIANILYAFYKNPLEWEKLHANPGLINSAIDECLRFEPPAHYIGRTCLEDFTWNGHLLKKDQSIILLLASANRDSLVINNPNILDIQREKNKHYSFGQGKHSCLGAQLAKDEFNMIIKALVQKYPQFTITSPVKWQSRKGHRWMEDVKFIAK